MLRCMSLTMEVESFKIKGPNNTFIVFSGNEIVGWITSTCLPEECADVVELDLEKKQEQEQEQEDDMDIREGYDSS